MNYANYSPNLLTFKNGFHKIKCVWLFSSKGEQAKRFAEIQNNPLKRWKMTPLDKKAQDLWDDYTRYKQKLFDITDTQTAPWHIINADKKSTARLRVINHLLERIPYNSSIEK